LYHQSQMRSHCLLALFSAPVFLLNFAMAGCRALPPSKPEAQWTAQEARGARVFEQECSRCHYPTTTSPRKGPGLQALTKVSEMPSGAPPTDERLTFVILHGRNMMPATQLSDDELSDLLAYLHTL
jgi:mono/diheme cytochrome c family protein